MGGANRLYHLAVVNSHPVQYFAPLYRRLASEDWLDLTVYFGSRAGLESFPDTGFGEDIQWDVPLIDGYESKFLRNLRDVEGPEGFWSLVNPGVVREIIEGDYDAVWLHGHNYATNLMAVAAARWAGSSLLMRCETHLGLDRPAWKRVLRKPVMTIFYRLFDACLAIGSENEQFYREHRVPDDKLFLVPYCVDNVRFEAGAGMDAEEIALVRRRFGLPGPDIPLVLFLSKLSRRKRSGDLLNAVCQVQERTEQDFGVVFVGTGPERDRLVGKAERSSLEEVHFLGFQNQSELPGIYGACDVFVLPSENEPWGLVVNEAMAAGLPVVASDEVGAAADLVQDGRNGHVYPCGDVAALTDRLEALLRDPERRHRMATESRRIINDWDFDRCVEGLGAALKYACKGRNT